MVCLKITNIIVQLISNNVNLIIITYTYMLSNIYQYLYEHFNYIQQKIVYLFFLLKEG